MSAHGARWRSAPPNRIVCESFARPAPWSTTCSRHFKIGTAVTIPTFRRSKASIAGTASADLEASVRMQRTDATGARS
jgi:hypothetical protein